jgi:acetoin utilization deacetylase AcuC-like enzyme
VKITAFVSHHDCPRHDTGWSHPDHQGRLPAVVRAVHKDMVALWEPLLEVEAVPARMDDLLLVHTPGHVARVRDAAARAGAEGAIGELDGVPVSGATWDAALAAAGAGITAAGAVLRGEARNAFCLVRPSGRGALPDSAGELGFFANAAILARHLRRRADLPRVLVVDIGVRPSATAHVLAADEGIDVVSVHQHPRTFPPPDAEATRRYGSGSPRSSVLPPGSGGEEVDGALRSALASVDAADSPGAVVLGLGLDVLEGDPLGQLAVRADDLYALTNTLRAWADEHAGGRLISLLEGGFGPKVPRAVVQHLRALAGLEQA